MQYNLINMRFVEFTRFLLVLLVCMSNAFSGEQERLVRSVTLVASINGHERRVNAIISSGNEACDFITGSEDGTIRQWGINDGHIRRIEGTNAKAGPINGLCVSGSILYSCSNKGFVQGWNIATLENTTSLQVNSNFVRDVTSVGSGQYLFAASMTEVLVWAKGEGDKYTLSDRLGGAKRYITKVGAHSYDDRNLFLVLGSKDASAYFFMKENGKWKDAMVWEGDGSAVNEVVVYLSDKCKPITVLGTDAGALIFMSDRGELMHKIETGSMILSANVSVDGKTLVSCHQNRSLCFWSTSTYKKEEGLVLDVHARDVCFVDNGRRLVCGCSDGTIKLIDITYGTKE